MSDSLHRSGRLILGCHLSIRRGFAAAAREARQLDASALQLFTRSPMVWKARSISDTEASAFRASVAEASLEFVVVHSLYLANLASPDPVLRHRSIDALVEELSRAQRLGIAWVVTHPGAHNGSGIDRAVGRIADGVARAFESVDAARGNVGLLLENTAGAGTAVGGAFGELAAILDCLPSLRLGVCLDTCHAFAAGYDLRTAAAVDRAVGRIDDEIGLDRLIMIHLNDSKGELASHVDRHEHLGRGRIGGEGLAAVVAHPRLARLPLVLETPKTMDGRDDADEVNLAWVRSIRTSKEAE